MDDPTPFKVGDLIQGRVIRHAPYGAWVQVADEVEGLLLIVNMTDDDRSLTEEDFPPIESTISALVIRSSTDGDTPRISLSTRDSHMKELG